MTRALYRNAEAAGFTVDSRPPPIRVYDRVHSTDPSWAEKVKKDDYKNLVLYKNNARMDEDNREIPILANSEYGHRLRALPEKFKRANVRIAIYNASTYRKNGIPFQKDQRPAV
ncbi:hypothetical protein BaRGS_00040278 [Batillaria attramentaria]|uniref:Uncharacterized protein n=1 Tax=Batillaria attramentaria TaxID=370345 RepID=A0ABD0J143_9CAEN